MISIIFAEIEKGERDNVVLWIDTEDIKFGSGSERQSQLVRVLREVQQLLKGEDVTSLLSFERVEFLLDEGARVKCVRGEGTSHVEGREFCSEEVQRDLSRIISQLEARRPYGHTQSRF